MIRSLLIIILLGLLAAGCTKKDEEHPAPKVDNTLKAPPSYDFVDQGFKNAELQLVKGKVTITFSYNGAGEFVVWLTGADNSNSHLIANIKGPKTDIVSVDIPKEGSYMLNIQTQGSYTVSVREKEQ